MRAKAVLLALLMATVSLSGCFGEEGAISRGFRAISRDLMRHLGYEEEHAGIRSGCRWGPVGMPLASFGNYRGSC